MHALLSKSPLCNVVHYGEDDPTSKVVVSNPKVNEEPQNKPHEKKSRLKNSLDLKFDERKKP